MDSEVFFTKEQSKWKGKRGLYVIECPLFSSPCAGKSNVEPVYKVGYAYQSLAVRIGDYRTHYGKIPFKIHLIVVQRFACNKGSYIITKERIH